MAIKITIKSNKQKLKAKPPIKGAKAREKLIALVEQAVANSPREQDGFLWAERSQTNWADMLGVSVATLRRIISEPPFVRDRAHTSDGTKTLVTLLRIGDGSPVKKTPRHLANIMCNIFRTKTGRKPDDRAYGCLVGCAEKWPEGHQLAIFKAVMDHWPMFMDCLRLMLDTGQIVPPVQKQYAKEIGYLKWQYPHIPTIRLGVAAAVEIYLEVNKAYAQQVNTQMLKELQLPKTAAI